MKDNESRKVPKKNITRKFSMGEPPKKNGWYQVMTLKEGKERLVTMIFRTGRWSMGEVVKKLPPMLWWTDEGSMADTAGQPIHPDGKLYDLVEIVVNSWAMEYKMACEGYYKEPWNKKYAGDVARLEHELRRPGLLNTCLCGTDPDRVIHHYRQMASRQ